MHLDGFEKHLAPGLSNLTWASLNIEGFLRSATAALEKLDLLVVTVNDIIENRIENNIKVGLERRQKINVSGFCPLFTEV